VKWGVVVALVLMLAPLPAVFAQEDVVWIREVEPRCFVRQSRELKETATLLVTGLSGDGELIVWVEDREADVVGRDGDKVVIEFRLEGDAAIGTRSVEVQSGEHSHTWNKAFYIVGNPPVQLPENFKTIRAGRSVVVAPVGVPLSDFSVSLGGMKLRSRPAGTGLEVFVPRSLSGGTAQFEVLGFGAPIWSEQVEVVPSPGIRDVKAFFDQNAKRLTLEVSGHHLPEDLEIASWIDGSEDLVELKMELLDEEHAELRGDVSDGIETTESVLNVRVKWLDEELYRGSGRWISRLGDSQWTWAPSGAGPSADSYESAVRPEEALNEIVLNKSAGQVQIGGVEFSFVYVPEKTGRSAYPLGLTEEQHDSPYLLERGFAEVSASLRKSLVNVPLLHPFLILRNEVTCAQYWQYLLADEDTDSHVPSALEPYYEKYRKWGDDRLPEEVRNRPVTDVSYLDLVFFIEWLQSELGDGEWVVRLPHEFEWEMAARADERKYSFPDSEIEEGLSSLVSLGVREVCSNIIDRSDRGVCDMTGNVSELTCTRFDRDILTKLDVRLDAGTFDGWDPQRPFHTEGLLEPLPASHGESAPVAVRGGANGEAEPLLQVSVRRSREWSDRDELTGFRLVAVKVGE
jgi:formylglycine-generating enzyme required for sulfatase activity